MNLLLLLSALLSALTGVNAGGVRAPVAAQQVAGQAATAAARVLAIPAAGHAPVQPIDVRGARRVVAPLVRLPRFDLPAFASRRRE